MTTIDFNVVEECAANAIQEQRFSDAIRISLLMGDGDLSLDAGWLAERIGYCCEAMNDIPAARFWLGRAVEENPLARPESVAARKRLRPEQYEDLVRLG